MWLSGFSFFIPINIYAKTADWKKIHTPHLDIYFPKSSLSKIAQEIAYKMDVLYKPICQNLNTFPDPIPLLILNQQTLSNGFFFYENKQPRISFFTFPSQDYHLLAGDDWLNKLLVHEFRHNVQHWCSLAKFPSFYLPTWFKEGDAVGIETVLSNGGRGRDAYFTLLYKVNVLNYNGFTYLKQNHNSLKHAMANDYAFGYLFTTYLRRVYGADIIRRLFTGTTLIDTVNYFGFYYRIKQLTGKNIHQIYAEANQEFKKMWQLQLQNRTISSYELLHQRQKFDTGLIHYNQPQALGDGYLVIQCGLGIPVHFRWLSNNSIEEKKIATPVDIANQDYISFSTSGTKFIWIAKQATKNHGKIQMNAIRSYDLATKRIKTLVSNTRYSYASLSPDGKYIIAVETDENYCHSLVLLNAQDGSTIKQFPNPANDYFLTPRFSTDGKKLITIRYQKDKANLELIDIENETIIPLIVNTHELIGTPVCHQEYVYYSSPYNGIDDIYAIHIPSKTKYQVTSSKYGAYNPAISADGKYILYNDYALEGMNAVKTPIDITNWIPMTQVADKTIRYYEPLIEQEKANYHSSSTTKTSNKYTVQDYHPNQGIKPKLAILPKKVNESLAIDPAGNNLALGILFENLLQKWCFVLLGLGYKMHQFNLNYFTANHSAALFTQLVYKGLSPTITLDASIVPYMHTAGLPPFPRFIVYRTALACSGKIKQKIKFFHDSYRHTLSFSSQSRCAEFQGFPFFWCPQTYDISWKSSTTTCERDLRPRFGHVLSIAYTHRLFGLGEPTENHTGTLKLFFPGFSQHHSFQITLNYLHRKIHPSLTEILLIGNEMQQEQRINTQYPLTAQVDYLFPLFYPDWEIQPIFFLSKRISARLKYEIVYDAFLALLQKNIKLPQQKLSTHIILENSWINVTLDASYNLTYNQWEFNVDLF